MNLNPDLIRKALANSEYCITLENGLADYGDD